LADDYSSPPERGEPLTNGFDVDGRVTLAIARLGDRALHLEQTVGQLQTDIRHLPTKSTLTIIVSVFVAVIALVSVAYWNGISGKFEGVNGRFEAINVRLDNLAKSMDKLTPMPIPAPSSTPHHH
jgi:hypothetical protein